jgi:hypothetical protein
LPPYGEGGCYAVASLRDWSEAQMNDDTQNNEPASPIGEGDSVTRNVMPMALVTELIDHVHSEVKEIDDVLAWNKKIGHRNPTRLKVVREVYLNNVMVWLEQLRDKMLQHETRSRSSEPSA